MNDLSYSDDAINVRGAFLGAKVVVYVEGDDDVLFWQEIFSRVADDSFEVEAVGGAPTLDEYIQKIASGHIEAIAARDSDYLPILGGNPTTPKVVHTYGYSIENSLYIEKTIAQLARLWCKSPSITVAECENWLDDLAAKIRPLMHLDAANAMSALGVATMGDNCTRFMTSANSAVLCPTKIAEVVAGVGGQIPAAAVARAKARVGHAPNSVLTHLRGHFLASAVHRFIVKRAKDFGRKVSISTESLYAAAILQFVNSLDADHPHRNHYLTSAHAAWQAV